VLSIVETNDFKELTHLQLTLSTAGDATLKRYLAGRLSLTHARLTRACASLATKEEEARELSVSLAAARSTSARLEAEWGLSLREEASQRETALASVAALHSAALASLERAQAAALIECNNKAEAAITAARARCDESAGECFRLGSEVSRLTTELTSARTALTAGERERRNAVGEADALRRDVEELRVERSAGERLLATSQLRTAVLEQQLEDLRALLEESRSGRLGAETLSKNLAQSSALYKAAYEKATGKCEEAARDVERAQASLDSLTASLNESRAKCKGLKEALRTADDRLAEAGRGSQGLQRELDTARVTAERERVAREVLEATAVGLRAQLEEAREERESHSATVAWLNKELTAARLGGGGGGGGAPHPSFTSPFSRTSPPVSLNNPNSFIPTGLHRAVSTSGSPLVKPMPTHEHFFLHPSPTNTPANEPHAFPTTTNVSSTVGEAAQDAAESSRPPAYTPNTTSRTSPSSSTNNLKSSKTSEVPLRPKGGSPDASANSAVGSFSRGDNPYLAGVTPLSVELGKTSSYF